MKPRVLVVEDDPEIMEMVLFVLRQNGFEASGAASGEAAWKNCPWPQPDLIVLDVLLPDLDGLSLCEMFRRNSQTVTTPILILTACATSQMRALAENAGANAFMTKPFALAELVAKVRDLSQRDQPALSDPATFTN